MNRFDKKEKESNEANNCCGEACCIPESKEGGKETLRYPDDEDGWKKGPDPRPV